MVLRPARWPTLLAAMSFRLGLVRNELPSVALYYLLAARLLATSEGDIHRLCRILKAHAGDLPVARQSLIAQTQQVFAQSGISHLEFISFYD